MTDLQQVLTHADGVLAQEAQDVQVLLQVTTGRYYSLNDVGARVWQLCDGHRPLAEVVAAVADEFDAPEDVIHADVVGLVDELVGEALLVEAR